jgi:hypothetical protein
MKRIGTLAMLFLFMQSAVAISPIECEILKNQVIQAYTNDPANESAQQRQARQRAEAIQQAQLDPFQQGQLNIQRGMNRMAESIAQGAGVTNGQSKEALLAQYKRLCE